MSSNPPCSPEPSDAAEAAQEDRLVTRRRQVRRNVFVLVSLAVALLVLLIVAYIAVRSRRVRSWQELAAHYGGMVGLDPALVLAVIQAESAGQPRAVSRAGALGLMQLMPPTARDMARLAGITIRVPDDLFDPATNVHLGTLYLARMREWFGDDPLLYLAAYNAGPGRVRQWRREHPELSPAELIDRVAFSETRTYVRRVIRNWRALSRQ